MSPINIFTPGDKTHKSIVCAIGPDLSCSMYIVVNDRQIVVVITLIVVTLDDHAEEALRSQFRRSFCRAGLALGQSVRLPVSRPLSDRGETKSVNHTIPRMHTHAPCGTVIRDRFPPSLYVD